MKVVEKRSNGTRRVFTVNNEPSMADQQFQKDCDVNEIVRKYRKGIPVTHIRRVGGVFADVSEVTDLLDAYGAIERAGDAFMTLPAIVRKRFDNDPIKLQQFVLDPRNVEEAIELGLMERVVPPKAPVEPGPVETPAGSKRERASSKKEEPSGE